jgi:Cu+-exporting ATPase
MITQVPTGIESLGQPAIDPVCGMEVDPANSEYQLDRGDHVVHFCCAGCQAKFAADPEKYRRAGALVAAPPVAKIAGAIYTCPMHPEIRRDAPGSCPICGMALEPLTITADEPPNDELADMTRRLLMDSLSRCRSLCSRWVAIFRGWACIA